MKVKALVEWLSAIPDEDATVTCIAEDPDYSASGAIGYVVEHNYNKLDHTVELVFEV